MGFFIGLSAQRKRVCAYLPLDTPRPGTDLLLAVPSLLRSVVAPSVCRNTGLSAGRAVALADAEHPECQHVLCVPQTLCSF